MWRSVSVAVATLLCGVFATSINTEFETDIVAMRSAIETGKSSYFLQSKFSVLWHSFGPQLRESDLQELSKANIEALFKMIEYFDEKDLVFNDPYIGTLRVLRAFIKKYAAEVNDVEAFNELYVYINVEIIRNCLMFLFALHAVRIIIWR